ncbi:MAG: PEP/pyruvate-binding domain-containing protein [Bdellovibrionales bacterium]
MQSPVAGLPTAFAGRAIHVYAKGFKVGRQLLRMTGAEYERMVRSEDIPPDAILLVDHLPLELDLPLVAGVITATPLNLEGSHVQVLAQKMGIPLAYVDQAYQDLGVRPEISQNGYWILRADESVWLNFSLQQPAGMHRLTAKAALPRTFDRTETFMFAIDRVKSLKLEIVGAKLGPLAELKGSFAHVQVPSLAGVSPGYYEGFLNQAQYRGQNLRPWLAAKLKKINVKGSAEVTKRELAEIRQAFQSAVIPHAFFRAIFDNMGYYFYALDGISIRTNNEIEDIIGAGVFSSAVAKKWDATELETAIRQVWGSMYTVRSYRIRQALGLREENLSMPLMLHPYVGNEKANGTGSFAMRNGQLVLSVNLVYGDKSKATNPSTSAITQTIQITKQDGEAEPAVLDPQHGPNAQIAEALLNLYRDLSPVVQYDFVNRRFVPESVEIEFLISQNNIPTLLQYKRHHSREVVLALLQGQIQLEDLDHSLATKSIETERGLHLALSRIGVRLLQHAEWSKTEDLNQRSYFSDRIAVIRMNGRLRIVAWPVRHHVQVKAQLEILSGGRIEWLWGGYLAPVQEGEHRYLYFSAAIGTKKFDQEHVIVPALLEELKENPHLLEGIRNLDLQETLQGVRRRIPLPLLNSSRNPSSLRAADFEPALQEFATQVTETQIIVLAEPHNLKEMSQIAFEAVQVLSETKLIDCLFVELPIELQSALDQFSRDANTVRLARAIYAAQRPGFKNSWRRIFADDFETQNKANDVFGPANRSQLLAALQPTPLSPSLGALAKTGAIKIWAYDVGLRSDLYQRAGDLQMLSLLDPRRFEQIQTQLEYYQILNQRNAWMAEQINQRHQAQQCSRSMVVVGADHLQMPVQLEKRVGATVPYDALNRRLSEFGLRTAALLVGSSQGYKLVRPQFRKVEPGQTWLSEYWNLTGQLVVSPK